MVCSMQDPLLRYGGMYAIALAYCGTANNKVIRKLLHIAVSDVNDDVRRSAVLSLGFVLLRYAPSPTAPYGIALCVFVLDCLDI